MTNGTVKTVPYGADWFYVVKLFVEMIHHCVWWLIYTRENGTVKTVPYAADWFYVVKLIVE